MRVFGTPQPQPVVSGEAAELTGGTRPIGEQIGLGPNAKTHRWSIQKALRQVAVGAALLGTMIGGGNVAYAQVGANLNVVPGATISVNSNFGQVQAGKPVVVDGIQSGAPMNASSTTSRFQPDASFDTYTSSSDQAVERAFIRTTAEAIPGGAQITVNSFHKEKDDKVTLWLMAEVLDRSNNQFRTITLATLDHNFPINPGSFRGKGVYDLKYEDVNRYLQARNPNLSLVPGETSLAVAAMWENGHQAGGFGRGGIFRLPGSAPVSGVTGANVSGATNNTPLPLDMQVAFPAELTAAFPQLDGNGNMVSRLESELKGTSTRGEMVDATKRMYELVQAIKAGNTAEQEARLGKGWKAETSSQFWIKDDGSANLPGVPGTGPFAGYRVNADGIPVIDPMIDVYMDDAQLNMTRLAGALRLRSNSAGVNVNIKPGGGRPGASLGDLLPVILQRIEWGFQMAPGTSPAMAGEALRGLSRDAWATSVFNLPQREITKLGSKLILSDALEPWLEVSQQRHKFILTNAEGVSIEFSFDFVTAKTLRPEHANPDGSPRVLEFYVLETELDHLATLGSQNQLGSAVSASGVSSASFSTNDAQDAWLKATSDQVTMQIDPRLHEVKDIEDEGFRSTSSYVAFAEEVKRVVPWLFPNGLEQGVQKAASTGRDLGFVVFDDASYGAALKQTFSSLGFQWTPEWAAKFDAIKGDPAKREILEGALAGRDRAALDTFFGTTQVANADVKVAIDPAAMTVRLTGALAQLGFRSGPEVEAMVRALARKGPTVREIEDLFRGLGTAPEKEILKNFAAAAGLKQAPALTPDVALLFGEQTRYGRQLRQQLDRGDVAASDVKAVEAFLKSAVATGKVDLTTVRATIDGLSYDPERGLGEIAQKAGLPTTAIPVLHTTRDRLAARFQAIAAQRFFKIDKPLMEFFKEVAKQMPRAEALHWAGQYHGDLQAALKTKADELKIKTPKLELDLPRLHASMEANLIQSFVFYTPELKAFVEKAVGSGVSADLIAGAFRQLSREPSMAKALQASGVDPKAFGAQVPAVRYDQKAVVASIMTNLQGHLSVLGDATEIDRFVSACLAKGLTAQQTTEWAPASVSTARQWALYNVDSALRDSLPTIKIEVAKVVAGWKAKYGAEWSPAKERYATSALTKALAKPDFYLSQVYEGSGVQSSRTLGDIFTTLSQASGMIAP
ncbi:MAG: hypothetical protein IPG45_04870 [Deltaproteobacteria bacterium]|nr:hypothetical protein [Deltaproteobacteria bacterium]